MSQSQLGHRDSVESMASTAPLSTPVHDSDGWDLGAQSANNTPPMPQGGDTSSRSSKKRKMGTQKLNHPETPAKRRSKKTQVQVVPQTPTHLELYRDASKYGCGPTPETKSMPRPWSAIRSSLLDPLWPRSPVRVTSTELSDDPYLLNQYRTQPEKDLTEELTLKQGLPSRYKFDMCIYGLPRESKTSPQRGRVG